MMQILVRKEGIDDLIGCYRHIVVDSASTRPHCPFERFRNERSTKPKEPCATAPPGALFRSFQAHTASDRDVACPYEHPRRSRALTMLAQIRFEGVLTE